MQQLAESTRPKIGKALGTAAAALLCLVAFSQPNLAHAEPHGGGGFRGGGGFHGGGFHPALGAFHGSGFHDGRFFGGVGWGGGYYPYDGGYYGYTQPSYSAGWYCANPAGYYPDVTQCYTAWQAVSG